MRLLVKDSSFTYEENVKMNVALFMVGMLNVGHEQGMKKSGRDMLKKMINDLGWGYGYSDVMNCYYLSAYKTDYNFRAVERRSGMK